jgi:hypothetical protein
VVADIETTWFRIAGASIEGGHVGEVVLDSVMSNGTSTTDSELAGQGMPGVLVVVGFAAAAGWHIGSRR